MRRRSRHQKAAIFVGMVGALLFLPMLRHFFWSQESSNFSSSGQENRHLAQPPDLPASFDDVPRFSREVDSYLDDHFGYRETLVRVSAASKRQTFAEPISKQVVVGRRGRVFLGNHSGAAPYSLIEEACGIGVSTADVAQVRTRLIDQLQRRRDSTERTLIVIVPTAPVLYPEDLPEWLHSQCVQNVPPAQRLMETWPRSMEGRLYFPLAEMLSLKKTMDAIPKTNFHWHGSAPHGVARMLAGRFFGRQQSLTVNAEPRVVRSDIAYLSPGVEWVNEVMEPDFESAGVVVCRGSQCFPELAELSRSDWEVSTYRRETTGTGSKLLVLADSFGAGIAGYFVEYFDQVVHVSFKPVAMLTGEQRLMFEEWRRAQDAHAILLLMHDGAWRDIDTVVDSLWSPAGSGYRRDASEDEHLSARK